MQKDPRPIYLPPFRGRGDAGVRRMPRRMVVETMRRLSAKLTAENPPSDPAPF